MDPDELALLFLALSFCGSSTFNPRNAEGHYYLFWATALSLFLAPIRHGAARIIPTPQFPISFKQIDEDGETKLRFQLPDFVCMYLRGSTNPDPTQLLGDEDESRTLGDDDIVARLQGPWLLAEGILAIIVEVKALPKKANWSDFTVQKAFEQAFRVAAGQAMRQAAYHFKSPSTTDTNKVVAFVCVADRWSWTPIRRDDLPRLSDYSDATFYLDSEDEGDEGDERNELPVNFPSAPKEDKGKKRARSSSPELGAEPEWGLYLRQLPAKRKKERANMKESPLTPDKDWYQKERLKLLQHTPSVRHELSTSQTLQMAASAVSSPSVASTPLPSSPTTSSADEGSIETAAGSEKEEVIDPKTPPRYPSGEDEPFDLEPLGLDWSPRLSWLDPRSDEQRLGVLEVLREQFPLAFAND